MDDIIIFFANRLLTDNMKPDQWSELDLLPIPKSGDLGETGNYRGISLSSLVAKLVSKMIFNRIQPKIDIVTIVSGGTRMALDQPVQQPPAYWP